MQRGGPGHAGNPSQHDAKGGNDTSAWPFVIAVPSDLQGLAALRSALTEWLVTEGVDDDVRAALVLATHEAAANAIEHSDGGGPAQLRGRVELETVVLEVSDRGRWKQALKNEERGRGLLLISALMDDVDMRSTDAGTTIRMWRRLG